MRVGVIVCASLLGLLAVAAIAAPHLGLRDPVAVPDGLVLRDLAPLSRVEAVRLADGTLRYVHETRRLADGSVDYRRGSRWNHLEPPALAGPDPRDWNRHELFVLGTDGFGRDLLSRLVHGARVSLLVGLVASLLALGVGGFLGMLAGLSGGLVDATIMRFTDLVLAVPRLFLALLLVTLYGPSLATTVIVLGVTTWMPAARLVRAEVLAARERDFVQAARASGASRLRTALVHLLPAAAVPLIVEGALRVGDTILLESALSFLGLGVPAPAPSWGNMIADGQSSLRTAWWIATIPGLAVAATVLLLNVVGDAMRERMAAHGSTPVPGDRSAVGRRRRRSWRLSRAAV